MAPEPERAARGRKARAALGLSVVALLAAGPVFLARVSAQDGARPAATPAEKKPDEKKPDEKKPDEKKPDEKKPDEKKPDEKKPDEKKPDEKKPDEKKPGATGLPAPPPELVKVLERWKDDAEPRRELARLYSSSLHYLLSRDLNRFCACFHRDFKHHRGNGELTPVPPAELRKLVELGWSQVPATKLTLEQLVDLSKLKVYSRKQASEAGPDGWKKEPGLIALSMVEGDWLVIAPTRPEARGGKGTDFEAEVFYVCRAEDGVFKIVLGE